MKKVLLVDDELAKTDESIAFAAKYNYDEFEYTFARDRTDALNILSTDRDISLVLLDIVFENMRDEKQYTRIQDISRDIWPDGSGSLSGNEYGLPILDEIRNRYPEIPVVMLSSKSVPSILLWCWKRGASYYIIKPPDAEDLNRSLQIFSRYIQHELLIGNSQGMQMVKERIQLVASSGGTISVLIGGESGTGKELVARSIHRTGPRRNGPFVVLNCAAIPEHLMESELFGHIKGSFTGATESRKGKLLDASKGVLFLDEIGELSLDLQSKMLRAIDRGMSFTPVGSSSEISSDVQIVAATNKNLLQEVEEGNFRRDLYYRLNVFPIEVPPLCNRSEDIPLLADHFLAKFRSKRYRAKAHVCKISETAMEALIQYSWPGNVRELENAVEYALVRASGDCLDFIDLPDVVKQDPELIPQSRRAVLSADFRLKDHIARVQWDLIKEAYDLEYPSGMNGLLSRIAKRLGLPNPADIQRTIIPMIKRECPDLIKPIDQIFSSKS